MCNCIELKVKKTLCMCKFFVCRFREGQSYSLGAGQRRERKRRHNMHRLFLFLSVLSVTLGKGIIGGDCFEVILGQLHARSETKNVHAGSIKTRLFLLRESNRQMCPKKVYCTVHPLPGQWPFHSFATFFATIHSWYRTSVADPWNFGTDPDADPRIHTFD